VTLSEHYGAPEDEGVRDVDWLRLVGEQRWPVLMKGELLMAECFIRHQELIWGEATGEHAALFAVSRATVRRVALDE
jgi:hypothetical protein